MDGLVEAAQGPVLGRVVELAVQAGGEVRPVALQARARGQGLEVEEDPVLEPQLAVQPAQPAPGAAAELLVGQGEPDVGPRADVGLGPEDVGKGLGVLEPRPAGDVPEALDGVHVVGREQPVGEPPGLARGLGPEDGVVDLAGVDGLDLGRVEDLHALEEEGPLLVVAQGVAEVVVDLGLVGLDLAEVGIGRQVQGRVGGQAELEVGARLEVQLPPLDGRSAPGERGHEGHDLDVAAALDGPLQEVGPAVGEQTRDVAGEGRIEDDLSRPGQVAAEDDVPGLGIDVREAQALERDGHFDGVALGVDLAVGGEDGVPAVVHVIVAALLDPHHVHLDPGGIEEEGEGPALLVEGVEHDEDPVVLHAAVALGDRTADLAGLGVEGPESDVEVLLVEGQVGHRPLGRDAVLLGGQLDEVLDLEGLGLPDGVVQDAVDLGGLRQARDAQGLLGGGRLGGREGGGRGRGQDHRDRREGRSMSHVCLPWTGMGGSRSPR